MTRETLGRTVFIILAILMVIAFCHSKITAQCDHKSDSIERFDKIRVILIDVKFYDGKKIEYIRVSAKEIHHGEFELNNEVELTDEFKKDYRKGRWLAIHCTCRWLYAIGRGKADRKTKN